MKTLIFSDNSKAKVIDENGRYYITKDAQFRKSNPDIVKVLDESEEAAKAEEKKQKAKKSPASKKHNEKEEEKGE